MGVNSGPQIARSGLVSYYDPGNIKSFRGLTATNVLSAINNIYGSDTAYFKTSYGTESAFIPYFNQQLSVRYVDLYNDYNSSIAQYGSQYCCPAPFSFHPTAGTIAASTTYTYQIIFKTDTGYYSTNYMYRYEYNGGTYVTEGGFVDASRMEALGDGWWHAWGQFTTSATTNTIYAYLFHYEYVTWNRIRVAAVSMTPGSTIHRPEHLIAAGASRGSTVAGGGGLLDLVGTAHSDLYNGISFTASNGGSLFFDGTNDHLRLPPSTLPTGSCTFEIAFRHTHSLVGNAFFLSTPSLNGYQIYFRGDWAGNLLYFLRFTTLSSYYGDSAWGYTTGIYQPVPAGAITHVTFTHDTSTGTMKAYLNGALARTVDANRDAATGLSTGYGSLAVSPVTQYLGTDTYVANALPMNLYMMKVYNRALTDAEVLTNYNAFKIRLGRSTNRNTVLVRPNLTTTGGGLYNSVSLFLDPANGSSYTRGSHRWQDLSSNRRVVTFYNAGGSTYNASAPGPPTFSTDGKGSFVFDGVNDFGQISSYSGYSMPSVNTVSVWIKTTDAAFQGIMSHCSGGPVGLVYGTGYSAGKMMYYYYCNDAWNLLEGDTTVSDGTWKNLVWVKSSTTGVKMYVNGILDKDATLVCAISAANINSVGSGWGPCNSGGYGAGTDSYAQVFSGSMGPLITWNRALSAAEVTQLYDAFKQRFGTNITTSGLSMNLDAGNSLSYPGSGTTWTDLTGINSAVTLTNGPAYASDSGGNLTFDGVDDYADFTVSGLGTTTTVEMWVKLGAGYSGKMFMGWLYYDVYCASGTIGYNTANSDVYGISAATVTSLGLVGNWKHYIFEMRSDVSYTNNKIYINGVSQTLSQQLSGESAGGRNFNGGAGRIAGWRYTTDYRMPMNLGLFRIYNRALTQMEITQNFNLTKSRFGVS